MIDEFVGLAFGAGFIIGLLYLAFIVWLIRYDADKKFKKFFLMLTDNEKSDLVDSFDEVMDLCNDLGFNAGGSVFRRIHDALSRLRSDLGRFNE